MKIGVIGAGRWGKNIVKTLHGLDVLAGVAEASAELRNTLTEEYPELSLFDNHNDLLTADVDAIAIATPVNTHYALAREALLMGKDVFVEKPLTVSASEADELLKLAKEQERILMVGHMLLYQPAIQFMKTFLSSGELGKIYSLRQVRRNLGTIRTHENALYSLGVHDLAVLAYLVSEPVVQVKAVGQVITTPGIEDDVSVHLQFASGIQAHLHVNWLWPVKDRGLMVLCEKGALHYDELAQQVVCHYRDGATAKGHEIVFEGESQPLKLEMQHFIECVEQRREPLSSGQQGRDVVALMEEVNKQLKSEADELLCA